MWVIETMKVCLGSKTTSDMDMTSTEFCFGRILHKKSKGRSKKRKRRKKSAATNGGIEDLDTLIILKFNFYLYM